MRIKLTFLITAGPTIEDLDPVRFISNRATGKLGVATAKAVLARGHKAILIHGPLSESVLRSIPKNAKLKVVAVRSAAQMHRAVLAHVKSADVVVMNAAVADFTPAQASATKLKKSGSELILRLKPTVDILKALGVMRARRSSFALIGFALETGSGASAAQRKSSQFSEAHRKLREKNLDAIVLDTPHAMGAERSDFCIITREGEMQTFAAISKTDFAKIIVALGEELRDSE